MLKDILYSTFKNKCPKCHKSNVFQTNNAYDLKSFDKMNTSCSSCGEVYEKELGFFTGAMYVSYALMVAWFVTTWVLDSLLFHLEIWLYFTFFISSVILLIPVTFRLSRLIWLNFFIKFDKEKNIIKTIKN
ncbi:MAG: DUF983 domain-containing protein [Bacteroidota bacterium]